MNSWEKQPRQDRLLKNFEKPTYSSPSISSFSSTILEGIYRSMEEENQNCGELKYFKEKISKTQKNDGDDKRVVKTKAGISIENEEMVSLRRARLVEKWMERKVNNKVSSTTRRWPCHRHDSCDPLLSTSDSHSSGTTTTTFGTFPSSDARFSRPKPVRTSVPPEAQLEKVKAEDEVWLIKSKLRALKIYNNLKKIKQPISPGGARLVSFLNSLFTAKKKKNTSSEANDDDGRVGVKTQASNSSTCSTTTSYYRSCLNKTSSEEKCNNDGVKRTVRFCPVTVDRRPCSHKCIYQHYPKNMVTNKDDQSSVLVGKKSLKIAGILKGYAKDEKQNNSGGEDNEEENDTNSDLSSDLFELDHMAFIGNKNNIINDNIRYCEELPVYETTRLRP